MPMAFRISAHEDLRVETDSTHSIRNSLTCAALRAIRGVAENFGVAHLLPGGRFTAAVFASEEKVSWECSTRGTHMGRLAAGKLGALDSAEPQNEHVLISTSKSMHAPAGVLDRDRPDGSHGWSSARAG